MRLAAILLLSLSLSAQTVIGGKAVAGGKVNPAAPALGLAQNTVIGLGSGSILEGTHGTHVYSTQLCLDNTNYAGASICPSNYTNPWVDCSYSEEDHAMYCKGAGGHDDNFENAGIKIVLSTSGGIHATSSKWQISGVDDVATIPFSGSFTNWKLPCESGCTVNCTLDGTRLNCNRGSFHTYGGETWVPTGEITGHGLTGNFSLFSGGIGPNSSGNSAVADGWAYAWKTTDTDYGKWFNFDADWTVSGASLTATSDWVLRWNRTTHKGILYTAGGSPARIWEWDISGTNNTLTAVASFNTPGFTSSASGEMDQGHNTLLVTMIQSAVRHIWAIGPLTGATPYTATDITSTIGGNCDILDTTANPDAANSFKFAFLGADYDSDLQKVILWPNYGNNVYTVDSTGACSKIALTGVGGWTIPNSQNSTFSAVSTFHRVAFDPSYHIHVFCNDWKSQCSAACLKPGGC